MDGDPGSVSNVVPILLICAGFVAAVVLFFRWAARDQRRYAEALAAAGFEPVEGPGPELERRLLALVQRDDGAHEVVCRHARREAGWTVFLQGIRQRGAGLELWELQPAVLAPELCVPRLTLVPRRVVGLPLGRAAGAAVAWRSGGLLRPVEFPEDPAFGTAYEVLGTDEAAVHDYLSSERRSALARMELLGLEADGDLFTFAPDETRASTPRDADWCESLASDARALVALMGSGVEP